MSDLLVVEDRALLKSSSRYIYTYLQLSRPRAYLGTWTHSIQRLGRLVYTLSKAICGFYLYTFPAFTYRSLMYGYQASTEQFELANAGACC